METVIKDAWDPEKEEKYKIELPADNIVEGALLQIDYPRGGLHREKITEILAEHFLLTEEQQSATNKAGQRVFNRYVGDRIRILINSGKMMDTENVWYADINRGQVSQEDGRAQQNSGDGGNTTEESIEVNYQQIRKELAEELLQQIKNNSPTFFEGLVIDLLVAMGYGGSREDAEAVGRSGDGGIDGIIKADPLGLNVVYIQAKRWGGNVGAPPVRDFVGALDGEGVRDGIFITTSDFNPAAKAFAERSSKRVILINGSQLARYMIDHNVGVSTVETYEIKRVDSDYFAENTETP